MTQDEIMELADKAGLAGYPDDLERFAALVREDEREACAKVCEDFSYAAEVVCNRNQSPFADGESSGALGCAAAIRARSE